jgi:hypothetical protein
LFQVGGPKGGGLPELAQRGLRRDNTVTENRSVGGSIPPLGTIFINKFKTMVEMHGRLEFVVSIRGVMLGNGCSV